MSLGWEYYIQISSDKSQETFFVEIFTERNIIFPAVPVHRFSK